MRDIFVAHRDLLVQPHGLGKFRVYCTDMTPISVEMRRVSVSPVPSVTLDDVIVAQTSPRWLLAMLRRP